MSIKQKLLLMGTLMALLVVAICGVGYYKAQDALTESTTPGSFRKSSRQ